MWGASDDLGAQLLGYSGLEKLVWRLTRKLRHSCSCLQELLSEMVNVEVPPASWYRNALESSFSFVVVDFDCFQSL